MTQMTPIVRSYFESAGWFEGRDISDNFKFYESKFLSDEAIEVMKQFGYLKVTYFYQNKDPNRFKNNYNIGVMFLDIDDSEASKVLRRDQYKQYYKHSKRKNFYNEYWETENIEKIEMLIKNLSTPLTRIGSFLNTGDIHYTERYFEIYMNKNGMILNHNEQIFSYNNFIEFCNNLMVEPPPFQEKGIVKMELSD